MSNCKKIVGVMLVLILATVVTEAQTSAQERSARLQTQLAELQAKQTELQTQLDGLNEQLKSENIEKSLAGVGSTKPEDLRELRRRRLEIEKSGLEKQLAVLSESRLKLETAIAQADALAYQQSALPALPLPSGEKVSATTSDSSVRPRTKSKKKVRPRRVNR